MTSLTPCCDRDLPSSTVVIGSRAVLATGSGRAGEAHQVDHLPADGDHFEGRHHLGVRHATLPRASPDRTAHAIVTGLGFAPVSWLQLDTARINSILLMVILIWMQVGFAMVLLSAAVKSVPDDTLEAARIDGANERQVFFQVIVPQIWPTVITVFITMVILVMKVFDIIYVMTGGNFRTDVIALQFFNELFSAGNAGRAAAIVVMLMIAVIPILLYQVRHYRAQEAAR